jgi:DNA-binding SARP family transcriptional activator
MFNNLRTLALRQLQNLDEQIRLVIIHPNYIQQHVVLAEFMDEAAAYMRFTGNRLDASDLREQLQTALELQTQGDATEVNTLLLDECDRADTDALNAFLKTLLDEMPRTRIIVISRHTPSAALDDEALRAVTTFIPYDETFMLWDYTHHDEENALLEVRAFGEGRVYLNGRAVDNWDGVLPRSLFFYLVDRGMTTRSEIFETFWPNLTTREATNVFHVTKRKISEVLGIDLTTYWSGFYRVSPNIHLSYDAILFTEIVQNSAVAAPQEAEALLSRAIALYRGQFLSSMDMDWANQRREELNEEYGDALAALAKAKDELGLKQEALDLYLRAAVSTGPREDLTCKIMQLYRELGLHQEALQIYDCLVRELESSLAVRPAPTVEALANAIRSEMHQTA